MPFLLADLWLRPLLDLQVGQQYQPQSATEHELTTRLFSYPHLLEFQKVVAYLSDRRYHQALPACERLLTRKPSFLPLYSWAAISAVELNLPYRAWQLVEDGVEQIEKEQLRFIKETLSLPKELEQRFDSERAKLCNILALAFARARNYRQALSYFEEAQVSGPTWQSWMVRGRLEWLKGAPDLAATCFRSGFRDCSSAAQRAAYHVELGKLRESQCRFDDGFRHFLQARTIAFDDSHTREACLKASVERGEFEAALAELKASDPFSERIKKNALLAHKLQDRTDKLEAQLSKGSRRSLILGRLYMRSGQVVRAIQAWVKGLDESPGDADCALSAAHALVDKGGWFTARQILETAIEHSQQTRGQLEDPRLEAARSYVLAQSDCPIPSVVRSLGRCLKLMNKLDRSKKRQQRVLEEACTDFIRCVCGSILALLGAHYRTA